MKKIFAIVLSLAVLLTMGLSVLSVSAEENVVFWTLDVPLTIGGWNANEGSAPIDVSGEIKSMSGWFGIAKGRDFGGLKYVVDNATSSVITPENLSVAEQPVIDACIPAVGEGGTYHRFAISVDQAYSDGDHTYRLYAIVDGEDILVYELRQGDGYDGTIGGEATPTPDSTPTANPTTQPDNPKAGDSSMMLFTAAAALITVTFACVVFKKKRV